MQRDRELTLSSASASLTDASLLCDRFIVPPGRGRHGRPVREVLREPTACRADITLPELSSAPADAKLSPTSDHLLRGRARVRSLRDWSR